jgi:hypothetical protein
MTSAARKFIVEERTIRLEERVGFIQADVAEIKAGYRHLEAKVDATRDDMSVGTVRESVTTLRAEMKEGFANVDRRMAEFATKADLAATDRRMAESFAASDRRMAESLADSDHRMAESFAGSNRRMAESFADSNRRMAESSGATDRRMAEFATKADLAATKSELVAKIDELKVSLMEYTDITFDRKFFRATGIMIGAGSALYAAVSHMEEMALSRNEIALVAFGAAIVIWSVSLFMTGRQHRRK